MSNSTLIIPNEIDFGFQPVNEVASQTITVRNTSREDCQFIWKSKDQFSITPIKGTIGGRKEETFTITFYPQRATRYNGILVCNYGNELHEISNLAVTGVAKIPHITVSTNKIDFGRVLSGSTISQTIDIRNSAPVPATVNIESDSTQFVATPAVFHLKPQGKGSVTISFHPTNFDFYAFANLTFKTAGGNSATIRVSAYVKGPEVQLTPNYLRLKEVLPGESSTASFELINPTNDNIMFQFLVEPTSVFQFTPQQGLLTRRSVKIVVKFSPKHPIAYYRRVICVFYQHAPIAIDVFGSAHDTFTQPPTISAKHIQINRRRYALGLMNKPPHVLEKVSDSSLPELPQVDFITMDLGRNQCNIQNGEQLFDELFVQQNLVTASSDHFEFGQCQRDVSPPQQTLTVKNNTEAPVTFFWQPGSDLVEVTPISAEIAKKQTADFKVKFNPRLEFQFMGTHLEGFAQYKEMRKQTLIDTPTLPFVITPFVDGHTMDDVTSFIPTMDVSHKLLIFAGVVVGDSTYQTFYVINKGDCAFKYDIMIRGAENPDENSVKNSSSAFSVYPQIGTIARDSFQIFTVRFSPQQRGHFHAQLFAMINDSPMNNFVVDLKGDSAVPGVSFSVTGTMFLHPVSLGSISTQSIQISNDSTVPVRIEWKIPSIYSRLLIVKPQKAEIRSREVIDCIWEFHPEAVGEFRVEVMCNVQALINTSHGFLAKEMLPFIVGPEGVNTDQTMMQSLQAMQHYPLTVCTMVTDCIVNSKPQNIDFGFVRINSAASSTLSISNHSDSQMHFLLQPKSDQGLLTFDPRDDVLPPRSSCEVKVDFTPRVPGLVEETILCSLLNESMMQDANANQIALKGSSSEICDVKGIGCYPHLSVVDIYSKKYSRETMWENCSINAINQEMEILGCDTITDDLKTFVIDFGVDVSGSEPTAIHIRFQNTGHIAFDFKINFPNDISINPENWALPDEIDPSQMKQDQIMQAKLFRVSEKSFHLEPDEETTVCFTYQHKYEEAHQLPVILKVQNGRIIKLMLKGQTLAQGVPQLMPNTPIFQLQPVPIGSMSPPIQTLRIFNPSQVDADYRIDLTQVQEINETNHNFEIFKCLNVNGTIKGRSFGYIQWIFCPLEAKEYEVSILCLVSDGNNFTVTLKGRGLHVDVEKPKIRWPVFPPRTLIISGVSPVEISEHHLHFGDLPIFAHTDRMIFVHNNAPLPLTFEADSQADAVKVEPRHGEIPSHGEQIFIVQIDTPDVPTIFQAIVPIKFSPPAEGDCETCEKQTVDFDEEEEEIIAADPPIGTVQQRDISTPMTTMKREVKSIGERTLENAQSIKTQSSVLFSTHIGRKAETPSNQQRSPYEFTEFLDVSFNAMSKDNFREEYGAMDGFYLMAQNPAKSDSTGQHKEEVADILGSILDSSLADEQVRTLAMREAKMRHMNIPYYSQLYKKEPEMPEPKPAVENRKSVDELERILREVINETIVEASNGTFPLDKDIMFVSGYKPME